MSWSSPRTWVTSEVVTAALLNAHVRDNLLETAPAKVTTAGDIVYATGANALARLAAGTTSQLLTGGASAPSWGNTLAGGLNLGSATGAGTGQLFARNDTAATSQGNSATPAIVLTNANTGANNLAELWFSGKSDGTVGAVISARFPEHTNGDADIVIGTRISGAFAERLALVGKMLLINDTSNANMTTGLTINQGTADDEILALKSSDVAHGMTTLTETDTYFRASKWAAADGGASLSGLSEATVAMAIEGNATTEDATRSTAGVAPVLITAFTKSGTSSTAPGADKNIVAFRAGSNTRFILDSDGDSHQDIGTSWTNFDEHDDLAVLNSLAHHVARPDNPIDAAFRGYVSENRTMLESLKLVSFNDGPGEDGRAFVNMSKLTMLLVGYARQAGHKIAALEAAVSKQAAIIADMRRMLPAPGGA